MSRYRCREHPDFNVTRRGTGCVRCEQEARQKAAPPADEDWIDRKLAAARRDTYTPEHHNH